MHFQKLQDRHKLCIFNITLLAYDYLVKQQRNSHDEYLVNKNLLKDHLKWKNTSNQGAGMIMVYHLEQSSQDSRNISKCQTARGKPPPKIGRAHV